MPLHDVSSQPLFYWPAPDVEVRTHSSAGAAHSIVHKTIKRTDEGCSRRRSRRTAAVCASNHVTVSLVWPFYDFGVGQQVVCRVARATSWLDFLGHAIGESKLNWTV